MAGGKSSKNAETVKVVVRCRYVRKYEDVVARGVIWRQCQLTNPGNLNMHPPTPQIPNRKHLYSLFESFILLILYVMAHFA
jgi:hypothetical protein